MLNWLKKFLPAGRRQQAQRDPARYEAEKQVARTGDSAARLALAANKKTHPEILFYLAVHDADPAVRQAVAKNNNTPVQASTTLAIDPNADVRLTLARRLITLLPELSRDKQSQLYAFCVQSLGNLALDEVLNIRKALSTALQDHAHTPPKIAGKLARDVEREVSEPILRFCAALADKDLLAILQDHPDSWVVRAIAGRKSVSEKVSRAVINTNDRPAGAILLQNEGANITETLMTEIVLRAREFPEWHEPIALRHNLPPAAARELAVFADASVRDLLLNRDDFDARTIEEISAVFRRRLDFTRTGARAGETMAHYIRRLAQENKLTEEWIGDALAMRETDAVIHALAYKARTSTENIERIFRLKTPKPIVALCWRCGLSMRLAYRLQQDPGKIPPRQLLPPRGGIDYPLSEDELLWQLEFLGLQAA